MINRKALGWCAACKTVCEYELFDALCTNRREVDENAVWAEATHIRASGWVVCRRPATALSMLKLASGMVAQHGRIDATQAAYLMGGIEAAKATWEAWRPPIFGRKDQA